MSTASPPAHRRIAHRKRGNGPSPIASIRVSPLTKERLYRIAQRREKSITELLAPVIARFAEEHDTRPASAV